MKRSPCLQPLSREHNTALKLARDARRAARNGTDQEVATAWRQLSRAWYTEMAAHFRAEEEILFPLLARHGKQLLTRQLLREHRAMQAALEDPYRQDRARLGAIGDVLNDHVRREEREAFPALEEILSPEQVKQVDKEMALRLTTLRQQEQGKPLAASQ